MNLTVLLGLAFPSEQLGSNTSASRIRFHSLIAIFLMSFLAASAHASTYTVKAGGGGSYTSIQACASAMSAGDTCTVYAGTYSENVSVSSGTSGNYKTLTVNSGDTVYVESFTIGSHVKINGFQIQNPSSPASAFCVAINANSTDSYITNNTLYACGTGSEGAMLDEPNSSTVTYINIQNNTFSYGCSTSSSPNVCEAMRINGNYQLIENNDLSHLSDGITLFGSHVVIRNNKFHDAPVSDCGSSSGNCHIDFVESEPVVSGGQNNPTQYNLYENNTELRVTGSNTHGFLAQGDACSSQCFDLIIRFNVVAHVGDAFLYDDLGGYFNVKTYNNTIADTNQQTYSGYGDVTANFLNSSTGGASLNNIYYYPESIPGMWAYATDSSTNASFTHGHNLAWCTGTCTFLGGLYNAATPLTSDAASNKVQNPNFNSYSTDDYTLASGSPALNGGTFETTVNGTISSSTALVVNDASYFSAISGISGVQADCISVTTVGNHICITAINYSTNTLTLANPISATNGDPVWLYSDSSGTARLTGSAPNMGALNTASGTAGGGSTPPPPLGLTSSAQ